MVGPTRSSRFGPTAADGNKGGPALAIYKGYLYAETNDRIVRYALPANGIAPTGAAQTVVLGLPLTGDHPMRPFAIDAAGNLYVDLGTATNSCQSENHMPDGRATIRVPNWRPGWDLALRRLRLDQHFSPAERFVTGLRNGKSISFDSAGRIFATQHGRDQLGQNWPKLCTLMQNA